MVDDVELTNDLRNIEKVRSEVGMVFQQFNLFPHLNILDNVSLAPIWVRKKPRAEAESQAMALLERVGIPEQASCRAGSSSGWPSPGPLPWNPGSCCSTSQPRPLTRR